MNDFLFSFLSIFAVKMKRSLFLIGYIMLVVCAYAQRPDLKAQKEIWRQMVADTAATSSVGKNDGSNSLSSHSLAKSIEPQVIDDFAYGLHQGLNVSLGASAFATFGHDAPHRGGFSQTMNALYLTPLTKDNRLWLGAGGYISHLNWGSDQYADAGLYGILDYRIDPHWEAYIYGQLSLSSNNRGYSPWGCGYGPCYGNGFGYYNPYAFTYDPMCGSMGYGMHAPGANVIGGGVTYHNKNFSLGISVENEWYPAPHAFRYFDQYNYPTPK